MKETIHANSGARLESHAELFRTCHARKDWDIDVETDTRRENGGRVLIASFYASYQRENSYQFHKQRSRFTFKNNATDFHLALQKLC